MLRLTRPRRVVSLRVAVQCLTSVFVMMESNSVFAIDTGCSASARLAFLSCSASGKDDYFTDYAKCQDSTGQPLSECTSEADNLLEEANEECDSIFESRLDLCEELDDVPHEPAFGAEFSNYFVNPLQIGNGVDPNPYFPLVQGYKWIYRGAFEEDGENIIELIEITVTNKTKLIDGITCLVVQDIVHKNGELVEDTDDWYAQDIDGNLWYCGEEVKDYEVFDGDIPVEPELVSNHGSFKSGVDGAKAGISLPGLPRTGDLIRQEYAISSAEDVIEVLAINNNNQSVANYGCNDNCLKTRDFSPMDPSVEEEKYYLPGIGRILEYHTDTPEARVELVEFITN